MFDFDNYCMNLVYEIETARHRVLDDRAIASDSQLPAAVGYQPLAFVGSLFAGVVARLRPEAGWPGR